MPRLLRLTLEDVEGKVVIENNMTGCFIANVGLRRGDALSVILFNLLLDNIIKKLDIRGNISTAVFHINAYANDVVIISRNVKTLEE
jgi:hypothetical protein